MPTPNFAARSNTTQQINYVRKTVNFSDAGAAAAIKFARLPQGAFIHDIKVEVVTAFNAGTTNVLTVGTSQASANEIVAAADVTEGSAGVTNVTTGLGRGLAAAADIDLYWKYTQTGTAATTGQAVIVIAYACNNDG